MILALQKIIINRQDYTETHFQLNWLFKRFLLLLLRRQVVWDEAVVDDSDHATGPGHQEDAGVSQSLVDDWSLRKDFHFSVSLSGLGSYLCCHQKGGTVSYSLGEEQSKVSFVMKMTKSICHSSSHDGVYTGERSIEEDHH